MYQLGTQLNNSSAYGYASFKDRTIQANSSLYPNASHYQRHTVEDALARELQRQKQADEARALEIEKIYAESEELKLLKHKIKIAQVNKERTRQISESQQRHIDNLRLEAELEDNLLRKCEEEKRIEGEKERIQLEWRLQSKYVLQEQIEEKKRAQEEAYQQYLLEKDQVDDIVQSIIRDDKKAIEEDKQKKKKAFQDMVVTLADKAERKANEKIHEQLENVKYKKFYEQKEQMQAQIKKKRAELEAHKAVIFDRLKKEEERRRKEKDLMDDLRMELYKEEFEAQERKKGREEKEKRDRAKLEMMADERQHKIDKARAAEEERRLEMEFRQNMMQKYQEESRMEQLSAQRKRQIDLDHKEQVERLWKERLEMYREIKEREQEEARRESELKSYKEELIKLEKERLLREYIDELAGFMPKGMLSKPEDTKYLKNTNPQSVRTGYASQFKIQ